MLLSPVPNPPILGLGGGSVTSVAPLAVGAEHDLVAEDPWAITGVGDRGDVHSTTAQHGVSTVMAYLCHANGELIEVLKVESRCEECVVMLRARESRVYTQYGTQNECWNSRIFGCCLQ
jgi:hypothetical protein